MPDTVDGPFTGLNLDAPGELLLPGQVQQADNVFYDSGDLVTRPGWEAMLSAPFGAGRRISAAFPIRFGGENYALLAIQNAGATGDELYLWQESAPTVTPTKVSGAVLFTTGQVQFAQLRDYVFIAGAQDGKLYRFRVLGSSIEATTGLTTPTRTLIAGVTNTVLSLATSGWAFDAAQSSLYGLFDADFTSSSLAGIAPPNYLSTGLGTPSDGWQVLASQNVIEAVVLATGTYVRLDQPGDKIGSKQYAAIPKANANGIGNVARKCIHYAVSFLALQRNSNQSVIVSVIAYDTGGGQLAEVSKEVFLQNINNQQSASVMLSFAGLVTDTQIGFVKLCFAAGNNNSPGGSTGAYVTSVKFGGVCVDTASTTPGVSGVDAVKLLANVYGAIPVDLADGTLPIGDVRMSYDFGSSQDLRSVAALSLQWLEYFPLVDPISVNLGFRKTLTGEKAFEVPLTEISDSSGSYLGADITTVPADYLQATRYLDLHFLVDARFAGAANRGQAPFHVGPILDSGPLTVGSNTYEYRYREWGATSSKASAPSPSIIPLLYKRSGYVVVSGTVPENAGANTEWFRRGGSFPDGLWRRIAYFPSGSNYNATYYQWNATTRTLLDKTPDSQLLVAPLLTDHDPAPFSATEPALAVGVHSARVAVATATAFYLSQVPQSLYDAGMYWDLVTDPNAVDVAIRGMYEKLSGQQFIAGDTVQRLLLINDDLVIFFRTSRFLLIGTSPANYQIRRDETDRGMGLLSPGAVDVIDSGVWFVSQDGLRFWQGTQDLRMSQGIETAVYPAGLFSGLQPNYNFLEKARIALSGGRIYLSIPFDYYEADCTALFVRDPRFEPPAWSRWTLPDGTPQGGRRGFGVLWTFGNTPKAQTMSVPGGTIQGVPTVTDALYVGTSDGQLFRLRQESGDILTVGGATSRVAFQVTGRKVIAGPSEWVRAERINVDAFCRDPTPAITIDVIGRETYTLVYFLQMGQNTVRDVPVSSKVTGRALWWRITVYSYYHTRLQQVGMAAKAEKARR